MDLQNRLRCDNLVEAIYSHLSIREHHEMSCQINLYLTTNQLYHIQLCGFSPPNIDRATRDYTNPHHINAIEIRENDNLSIEGREGIAD